MFSGLIHNGFYGKKLYQWLFEKAKFMSLYGMNYGNAVNVKDSGEINIMKLVKAHYAGETDKVIFDVGANRGEYCGNILSVFGQTTDDWRLFCFEPSVVNFEVLVESFSQPNVYHINKGLSSEIGFCQFYESEIHTLSSLYNTSKIYNSSLSLKQVAVELTTINQFVEDNGIAFIHFLKIDVEGHELAVLKGAINQIQANKVGFIQFEFGASNVISRTFLRDFFDILFLNYTIHRVLKDGISNALEYSVMLEVFLTANYLAIPRGAILK